MYDNLKLIEVSWKAFFIVYLIFCMFMVLGSFIFSKYFAVSTKFLITGNVWFFVVESLTLLTVFMYAVKQEEICDIRTLADLTNRMNQKS